ncbi:hypothetical protein SISSUDRAFT_588949 [Sistotremastrum suecicum HHB10207 ss-3]|uniref:Uncharacterized protein n=1 Tax=Sistotremastrum suecicum HHB10207 ss-3 TaxID=1314776 RepID=A0A166ELE8_9AGAM|nr:hypothetical protein SISSUDRAFT_588949 [Sistotremastrum suecicum HHB10207 ss-3]
MSDQSLLHSEQKSHPPSTPSKMRTPAPTSSRGHDSSRIHALSSSSSCSSSSHRTRIFSTSFSLSILALSVSHSPGTFVNPSSHTISLLSSHASFHHNPTSQHDYYFDSKHGRIISQNSIDSMESK